MYRADAGRDERLHYDGIRHSAGRAGEAVGRVGAVPGVGEGIEAHCTHKLRPDFIGAPLEGATLGQRAAECGQGFSSVALAGGLIYTAGDLDGRSCVVAFDLDGKRRWKAPNGLAWRVPRSVGWGGSFDGTRATPTFDDGRVYHLSAPGRPGCFDAKTGRELWAVDVTKRFQARRPIWANKPPARIWSDRPSSGRRGTTHLLACQGQAA